MNDVSRESMEKMHAFIGKIANSDMDRLLYAAFWLHGWKTRDAEQHPLTVFAENTKGEQNG